ncbi:Uncharacterised protein [Candidatus Tiddalikarchaeum anstoanum]|nr:Uncharacterised protein [Candidatus Tiddalikarchaeum anstoanum]
MIETFLLISVAVYLIISSINDIRFRFVHDYTTYSFGVLFILLRILLIFETNDAANFLNLLFFAVPVLIVSLVLYKIGWWGGGDAKMITALAIAIPFLSTDAIVPFSTTGLKIPFFFNFITNTLIGGLLFGLIYSFILAVKKRKEINKVLTPVDLVIVILLFGTSIVLFFFDKLYKIFSLILFFIPISYLVRKVENIIQTVDKSVKSLEPGDWIFNDIKVGKITVKKTPTGLSKDDIKILQKSKLKTIKIRDGIPFVPSFLIGLILAVFYGNVLINFLEALLFA